MTNSATVIDFINAQDPIRFLTDTTAITFLNNEEDEIYRNSKHTSEEVMLCMKDLKVRQQC